MKTGLRKEEKVTEIRFDEKSPIIFVTTFNTSLKKRLSGFAEQYPEECVMTDSDEDLGMMSFEIRKGRLSLRLTSPYSEERKAAAKVIGKQQSKTLKNQ